VSRSGYRRFVPAWLRAIKRVCLSWSQDLCRARTRMVNRRTAAGAARHTSQWSSWLLLWHCDAGSSRMRISLQRAYL